MFGRMLKYQMPGLPGAFFCLVLLFSFSGHALGKEAKLPLVWVTNASIFKSLIETGSTGEAAYLKAIGDGDCQGMSIGRNQANVAGASMWNELFKGLSKKRRDEITGSMKQPYRSSFRKILAHLRKDNIKSALKESRKTLWQNKAYSNADALRCATNSGRPGVKINNRARAQLAKMLAYKEIKQMQIKGEVRAARHAFKLAQAWRWKTSPLGKGIDGTACSRISNCSRNKSKRSIKSVMPKFREFLWFFDRTVNSRAYLDLLQDPLKAVPWEDNGIHKAKRMARLGLAFLSSCPTWKPHAKSKPVKLCSRYPKQFKQAQKNHKTWMAIMNKGKVNQNQIRLFNLAYIRSQFGSPVSFWLSMNRRGTIAMGRGCASKRFFSLDKIYKKNGYGNGARLIKAELGKC